MLKIDIISLFPEMFAGPFSASIVRRAIERGLVSIVLHDLRNWAHDRRRTVDDVPFGGGPGMILRPDPIFEAVDELRSEQAQVILLSPNGKLFDQATAGELARNAQLILICGHYEGVDERVADHLATRVISIGDYVLTGGEIPAMVITDAVVRLLPGALGCADSTREEAHAEGVLEYPQYTRPAEYRGLGVPEVLRSGHHQELETWKRREALRRTWQRRRELLDPPRLAEMQRLGLLDVSPSENEGGHACG